MRLYLSYCAYCIGILLTGLFAYLAWMAMLEGGRLGKHILYFNKYAEGWPEVALLSLLTVAGMALLSWDMRTRFRRRERDVARIRRSLVRALGL